MSNDAISSAEGLGMLDHDVEVTLRAAGYGGGFSLSDIISECGDAFQFLRRDPTATDTTERWTACSTVGDGVGFLRCKGPTALLATARLWLALHPSALDTKTDDIEGPGPIDT
jgi:hypothetical protein